MGRLKGFLLQIYESTASERRRIMLNLLEKDSSAKLVDLGCMDGNFTKELGKRIGTTELYGVDIVEGYIQQADRNGVKVYLADLNDLLPIDGEAFDVVHGSEVIEHICKTDTFVREIYRILRPGGYAVISTPNLAALHHIFSLILGLQPIGADVSDEIHHVGNPLSPYHGIRREANPPQHLRLFTSGSLKELFEYHGFKVERIAGVGYYPFPVNIARILSTIDPRHAVYLTMKVRKERRKD